MDRNNFLKRLRAFESTLDDLDGNGILDVNEGGKAPSLLDVLANYDPARPETTGQWQPQQAGMVSSNTGLGDEVAQRFGPQFGPFASAVERGLTAARPVAREFTGLPSIQRGAENLAGGRQEGNPAQMLKGVGEAGLGMMPYLGGGLMKFGAALGLSSLDSTMPQAQAAQPAAPGMPPIPEQNPRSAMPPLPVQKNAPAITPRQQQAAPAGQGNGPSWWDTLVSQFGNNASAVGDYASRAYDEAKGLLSGVNAEVLSKDAWAEQNAKLQLDRIKQAEALVARESSDGGYGPKTKNAEAAAQVQRDKLDAAYEDYVKRARAAAEREQNLRFSERNPALNGLLLGAPIALAAGLYRQRLARNTKELRGMIRDPQSVNMPPAGIADAAASSIGARPGYWSHVIGGLAGTTAGKAAGDVYDRTVMDPDSGARKRTVDAYTTPEGLRGTAAEYAMRTGLTMGGVKFAGMTAPTLSQIEKAKALRLAGMPNVDAIRARAIAERAAEKAQGRGRAKPQTQERKPLIGKDPVTGRFVPGVP